MTPYNQILTLHLCGYNNSQIAKEAGCARGTVIDVLKRTEQSGLIYPSENEQSDLDLHRLLHAPLKRQEEYLMPDLGPVLFSIELPRMSISKAWSSYTEKCAAMKRKAYSKSAFQGFIRDLSGKYEYREYDGTLRITILKDVRVGDADYNILYAELSYAGGCFALILENMKPRTWTMACRKLLRHIGGVPDAITYVGHIPKPLAEETRNFAAYYDVALDFEKDNEFGVWLTRKISEEPVSIARSPEAICARLCQERNDKPIYQFSEFNHTDAMMIQKAVLRTVPLRQYETVEVRHPTVQMNFHVELEGKYYSVPFEHRHERFTAEITDSLVELSLDDILICVHDRIVDDSRRYSTYPEHMPADDDMIPWGETSGRSLRAWAKHIGFATFQVTDFLLKRSAFEAQAYKTCTALLSSAKRYGNAELNAACKAALSKKDERINLRWINAYLDSHTGAGKEEK